MDITCDWTHNGDVNLGSFLSQRAWESMQSGKFLYVSDTLLRATAPNHWLFEATHAQIQQDGPLFWGQWSKTLKPQNWQVGWSPVCVKYNTFRSGQELYLACKCILTLRDNRVILKTRGGTRWSDRSEGWHRLSGRGRKRTVNWKRPLICQDVPTGGWSSSPGKVRPKIYFFGRSRASFAVAPGKLSRSV